MADEVEPECKNLIQFLTYKLDRTIAILGLVALGLFGMWIGRNEAMQVSIAVAGALAGYLGTRSK
jgi:type IV secretory pathway VirB2 component (pilin)